MDDRLHRALDEETPSHELTPRVIAELDEMRGLLTGISRAIPDEPIPDLGASVVGTSTALANLNAQVASQLRLGGLTSTLDAAAVVRVP